MMGWQCVGRKMSKNRRGITPSQRHEGHDVDILAKRNVLYQEKNVHPDRWSKNERNWQPIGNVGLNPEQYK